MYPTQHAAATLGVIGPLARRGWHWAGLASFAAAAVLIDVDHYLSYIWHSEDLSLKRAYQYHHDRATHRTWKLRLHWPTLVYERERPFHAVAVLLLLFALARRWPALMPVAWGALFHRLLDYSWESVIQAA